MNRISELLSLNTEQEKLIDIENHYVVQAGAGSGKTRVLVSRYLQILESGKADINQIVAITFTINAANEMKERIRKYLKQYINRFGENNNINSDCLKDITDAPISTIHGFAARIIRENPYECNINSKIKILEGLDRKLFVDQSIDEYLSKNSRSDKNITEIFEDENYSYSVVKNKIKEILDLVCRHHISVYEQKIENKELNNEINKLYKKLAKEIQDGPYGSKNSKIDVKIKEFHKNINQLEQSKPRNDKISLLDKCKSILSNHGSPKGILELKVSSDIERHYAALCAEIINQIINLYELDSSNAYLKQFWKFYGFYNEKKRLSGYLEYEDLLQLALRLLKKNPEILKQYGEKYKYFLIDEFQDTDKIQYEIINLFNSSNRFIVGDPKQSIFGFRGATPEIFTTLQKTHSKTVLTYNYRSDYRLITFYNELFKIIIKDSYQEMKPISNDKNKVIVKEVIHSHIGKGEDRVLIESGSVAKKISELVASGYKKRDIAILLRSKSNIASYENALTRLSIPYYSSEEAGFYRYSEIRDMVSMLKYIVNKNDKISEASVLRSTFLGAADTELFNHYVKKDSVELIDDYLEFIDTLREKSLSLNPLQLLLIILNETMYWPAMLALPDGTKKYSSITKLTEIFSHLELQGKTLSEILNFLDLNYEENTEGLSQLELDESDTVKILTVHKAKGLEFPVVILADINHGMGGGSESVGYSDKFGIVVRNRAATSNIWKDMVEKQKQLTLAEEKRSLYVAMTRAKEKLILSVCSDTRVQKGSYLEILNALMPLTKIESDDEFMSFKDYQIPITHSRDIKTGDPIKESKEECNAEEIKYDISADPDFGIPPQSTEEITAPELSIYLNNMQIGSVMHRFLQIWNFEMASIENTINYALTESHTIDPDMRGLLKTLADNFLSSDLYIQIKGADDIERELPFYIELDGKNERRKIDLLIFKDKTISLFDYKTSSDIKEEYIEQMNLYEKALIKKYSCNNIDKNLVNIPGVVINKLD